MAWYWWLALAAGAVIIVVLVLDQRDRYRALDELERLRTEHFSSPYDEDRIRTSQIDSAIAMVFDLPILPKMADSLEQSGAEAAGAIRRLLDGETGRSHVVQAPHKIVILQEPRSRSPAVIIREYGRIGSDRWSVRERQATDFEAATAEAEADDVVEMVICSRCQTHNRIRILHGSGTWKCGKCGAPL